MHFERRVEEGAARLAVARPLERRIDAIVDDGDVETLAPRRQHERQLIPPAELLDEPPPAFREPDHVRIVVQSQKEVVLGQAEVSRKAILLEELDEPQDVRGRIFPGAMYLERLVVRAATIRMRPHLECLAGGEEAIEQRIEVDVRSKSERRIDPDRRVVVRQEAMGQKLDALGGLRLVVGTE